MKKPTQTVFQTSAAILLLSTLVSISACSSDSDSKKTNTGQLIDSAVEGVSYKTNTKEGVTDEKGNFDYLAGEDITFSIGNIVFPSAEAGAIITPLTLANNDDLESPLVVNIARLLQSLDSDADPSNGITINLASDIETYAIDFDQSVEDFETAAQDLMDDLGIALVSEEDAINHLEESLELEAEGSELSIIEDITLSFANSPNQTYFDFSTNTVSASDSAAMDIAGTSNENGNFGGEYMQNRSGKFLYLLASSGSLENIPTVPTYANATPWVNTSWEGDGTNGQPISVGELWVVYTVENHYAVMEITEVNTQNDTFTFDYVYNSDGSKDF